MKFGILQLNFKVGDIAGNIQKIFNAVKSSPKNTDLFITSELAVTGYPPKDILLNLSLIENIQKKVEKLALDLANYPPLLLGSVIKNTAKSGKPLFNSALLIQNGKIVKNFNKILLPTYDVFDEDRYFEPGKQLDFFILNGKKIRTTKMFNFK